MRLLPEITFPNENPIGRRLQLSYLKDIWWEIVGATGEIKHDGIGRPVGPGLCFPLPRTGLPA